MKRASVGSRPSRMCRGILLCFNLVGLSAMSADSEPLPGPALEVPVDVDGDGASSYGDLYFFNYWLESGGDLGESTVCGQGWKRRDH